MSDPKFSIHEAVMIRFKYSPEFNRDFAIIIKIDFENDSHTNIFTGEKINNFWIYQTNQFPEFIMEN